MFGLFRTTLFVGAAFLAGVFFERSQGATACADLGGITRDGVCRGAPR